MPVRKRVMTALLGEGKVPKSVITVGAVLVLLLLAGQFAPLPYDPEALSPSESLLPPSSEHWFGTDGAGSDVFSRTIAAARLDLPLALAGMLLSLAIGVPIGLVASRPGRMADRLMRSLDMFQAFPLLVLAIAIVALAGNQLGNIVVAIALVNIPRFIRLARSEAMAVRKLRFVQAAEAFGATGRRVMFRHILPNITGTILAQASLATAHAIVIIAALSYLGIGVSAPTASWGAMIKSGSQNLTTGQWWGWVFPGIAVLITVFSLNHIAEWLDTHFRRAGGH